jgi:hypothetical protein
MPQAFALETFEPSVNSNNFVFQYEMQSAQITCSMQVTIYNENMLAERLRWEPFEGLYRSVRQKRKSNGSQVFAQMLHRPITNPSNPNRPGSREIFLPVIDEKGF